MPYTYNTPADVESMLEAIGAASIEELFKQVPDDLRLQRQLELPPAMHEMQLDRWMRQLSGNTDNAQTHTCFLGGGSYDHFIPAVVDEIASRGEFYTSYTPYQAEVSQGNLQVVFEYQTLITQLIGLDISNASLYDGGSATAEAVLMAVSSTRRYGNVIIPENVHPEYRRIVTTYLENLGVSVSTVATPDGTLDPEDLREHLSDQTACVILQQPNFFGIVEDLAPHAAIAHEQGALVIAAVDPISLGLLKRPGDWGADIAVAEGQSLGTPMQYGGPYLGIIACREKLVRRMPGRIAGETVDRRNNRCFVLTLQTREQHIRREKATSNICSNQGLFALRATIYLSMLGPSGLKETANHCLQKSQYAAQRIAELPGYSLPMSTATFKEFVVRDESGNVDALVELARQQGIFAGIPLGRWYPDLGDCLLVAVTEKRTKLEIDQLVDFLAQASSASTSSDTPQFTSAH